MGSSTTDGSSPALDAPQPTPEPSTEAAGRGFFGRLLSAFSPNATEDSDNPEAGASHAGQDLAALRHLRVDDVALPNAEIVAVPLDISLDDLVEVFRKHGFSRVPVYKGSLDHPQGLVLLKDLALKHGFGSTAPFKIKELLRPILYAPPSMPTGILLQKMQKERAHMALVIDEYGGVDGLVTIEDLIETVIGEIEDEHDEVEGALWREESPGVYLARSTAPVEDLEKATGIKLRTSAEDEEIDTIGGLVFQRTGRVPAIGETLELENGLGVEVIDADARRLKALRLRLPAAASRSEAS